jgi:hypothetical protein
MVIRTPDQRLRVFVSSTLGELAEERRAVARAIAALRLTPVMFELGARPYPPRELYRAYLAQSDVFIGLYWQRYGWIGPGMETSGLEEEFELARGLPRLLYVKAPAPGREPRLADLLARIREEGLASYRTFGTPAELGRLVRDDLAVLLSEQFAAARRPVVPRPASSRGPRPLPVSTTSLVGRERDIDEVAGSLETAVGRHDDAGRHLREARDLAEEFDSAWLTAGSRVQLAILDIAGSRLGQARALLDEALNMSLAARSTPFVTLSLTAYARLTFAEGDPERAAMLEGAAEGLRQRVGLGAWPMLRRGEAELAAQVRQTLGADRFDQAFDAGSGLSQREAVAAVRGRRGTGTQAP